MINRQLKFKLLLGIFGCNLLFITSTSAAQISNLRGQRYCEIIISPSLKSLRKVNVYNTIGLNQCPADQWNKITNDSIKKDTGATFVHLNGPRYWTIDGMTGNTKLADKTVRNLGGIDMRQAAVLDLSWSDVINGGKAYQIHIVNRETTYVYKAHEPIYELVNPQGEAFVMQSYSIQKISQTEAGLSSLGKKLSLPEGWHFQTRVLDQDSYLSTVDHKAQVIQDNFLNSYQKETSGFVKQS